MKNQLRKDMLAARERMPIGARHEADIAITEALLRLSEYEKAGCIFIYASTRGEVRTDGIIRAALAGGKQVALPVTRKETGTLELYRIQSLDELAPGAYRIFEPPAIPERRRRPAEVEMAVIPGVAFDRRGARIGYGAGYYDRLLPAIECPKIALAFAMQIAEEIPDEAHDVRMDWIVTEKEVIDCAAFRRQAVAG